MPRHVAVKVNTLSYVMHVPVVGNESKCGIYI
jgi:hypothetical protein